MPTGKKVSREGQGSDDREDSPVIPLGAEAAERAAEDYSSLKDQVASLTMIQDQMTSHIGTLTKQYQNVIGEMLTFQKNMVQQDQLMQNLVQYLVHLEQDKRLEGGSSSAAAGVASMIGAGESSGPFVPSNEAQKLIGSYADVAKASFAQMNEISLRAGQQNGNSPRSHSLQRGSISANSASGGGAPLSPKSQAAASEAGATSPTSGGPTPGNTTTTSGPMSGPSDGPRLSAASETPSVYLHPPHFDEQQLMSAINSPGFFNNSTTPPAPGQDKRTGSVPSNNAGKAGGNGFFQGTPFGAGSNENAGLRVFTVGTLQPRQDDDSDLMEKREDGSIAGPSQSGLDAAFGSGVGSKRKSSSPSDASGLPVPELEDLPKDMPRVDKRADSKNSTPRRQGSETGDTSTNGTLSNEKNGSVLRVRRSTYVPGWAVPPRVLLVDDDAVHRKLGSKFLQVFGCAIDVAVDGVSAVNKMNLEKYDLVLMDIVMPNLDGVSATSLIRQFDPRTPIISMTSNSQPNELLTYMNNGMNDILPKPFTKEGLLNMLEVSSRERFFLSLTFLTFRISRNISYISRPFSSWSRYLDPWVCRRLTRQCCREL